MDFQDLTLWKWSRSTDSMLLYPPRFRSCVMHEAVSLLGHYGRLGGSCRASDSDRISAASLSQVGLGSRGVLKSSPISALNKTVTYSKTFSFILLGRKGWGLVVKCKVCCMYNEGRLPYSHGEFIYRFHKDGPWTGQWELQLLCIHECHNCQTLAPLVSASTRRF